MSLNTPRRRERRRAAGAGSPRTLRPPDRPGGALRRRRPCRRSSKAQTSYTLTGAARQTPPLLRAPGSVSAHKGSPWRRRTSADWWRAGWSFVQTHARRSLAGRVSRASASAVRLARWAAPPPFPSLPAPRPAPDPLFVDGSTRSQGSARSAPRVPRAWPPPQFPGLLAPGPAPRVLAAPPRAGARVSFVILALLTHSGAVNASPGHGRCLHLL